MFTVTVAAANQVQKAAGQSGAEGMALRLAARKLADGTVDYRMGFDDASEDDIRFSSEGVDIVMAPEDVPLLSEAVLDFVEIQPGEFQFIFLNPKDANYSPPTDETPGNAG